MRAIAGSRGPGAHEGMADIGGRHARMGSIGRYIFRTTLSAFAVVLVSVTMLMWITQALRNIDLMTNQGQTILVFIGLTGLIIPLLVLLIAPIALMIAVAHTLNKLGNDSELIVMNAAGMRPWQVFWPFLSVGIVVTVLVGALVTYISPQCLRELRRWGTEVRAEFVANTITPGRFAVINGITFHVRARESNGQLTGLLIDDRRDEKERITILAEYGDMLSNDTGLYLVLRNGTVQRHEYGKRDPAIVAFTEYAFNLSRLMPSVGIVRYSVQERFLWELWDPPPGDVLFAEVPGRFQAELHNRLTAPLYPLAFLMVTFAFLGMPRTTRQNRAMSLISAIVVASAVRGLGFLATVASVKMPLILIAPYVALAATILLSGWAIARGVILEPPPFIANWATSLMNKFARRTGLLLEHAP